MTPTQPPPTQPATDRDPPPRPTAAEASAAPSAPLRAPAAPASSSIGLAGATDSAPSAIASSQPAPHPKSRKPRRHSTTRTRSAGACLAWYDTLTDDARITVAMLLKGGDVHYSWPFTTAARTAAALRTQADQLTQQGETYKAHPLLCQLALYTMAVRGTDSAESVRAVYRAVRSSSWQGSGDTHVYVWLMPRFVGHFGIGHPDTGWLVQHGAVMLCHCKDPRQFKDLTQLVTDIAQHLPGGLGWGSTVVAPVADEAGYCRHAFMACKAPQLISEGNYKLAYDMLTRCVAYFETLGHHWLGAARKAHCARLAAQCVSFISGYGEAEPVLRVAKRVAQRELGMSHIETLTLNWSYAEALAKVNRPKPALSLLQKTLRLFTETLGAQDGRVIDCQYGYALVLKDLGMLDESLLAWDATFTGALKTYGTEDQKTRMAVFNYWSELFMHRGYAEARAFKRRAAELGCDVSRCATTEDRDLEALQAMNPKLKITVMELTA